MIKVRPLMEVPKVVHKPHGHDRPSGMTPRLPTPPSPRRGKGPFIGLEIREKSLGDSPRKRWVVKCPKDCPCRAKPKGGRMPKWLLQWQATQRQELEASQNSIEAKSIEEHAIDTGSQSLNFSKIFPATQRSKTVDSSLSWSLGRGEDEREPLVNRYKHHKSNVRQPRIFTRSKTTGVREMTEEEPPMAQTWNPQTWNRMVSEVVAPEETWERRPERRTSELLGFGMIISLAKKHGIPPQEVRQCAEEFRAVDTNRDGRLSMVEFENLVRKRCGMGSNEAIPETLAGTMQKALDDRPDSSGGAGLSFEDFLLWVWQCIFMEEMSATDSNEREQRNLARELKLELPKLESLRDVFNSCDDDGSGFIEWPEFDQLVRCLLDAKEATDVSEALLRRYWSEANDGTSESIGFPNFVRWYAKNFA